MCVKTAVGVYTVINSALMRIKESYKGNILASCDSL